MRKVDAPKSNRQTHLTVIKALTDFKVRKLLSYPVMPSYSVIRDDMEFPVVMFIFKLI